jgi:RNA polymerase primary sigma factor
MKTKESYKSDVKEGNVEFSNSIDVSYFSHNYTDKIYLIEIKNKKGLSSEEEEQLSYEIQKNKSKDAINKLVESNLLFVASVARNYTNQGLPISDLINEGNLGLYRAAKRFDSSKGFKFISYAVWWVRQAILQALAENSRIIKIPLNKISDVYRIRQSESRLEQKYKRPPTLDEIADEVELDEEEVEDVILSSQKTVSLDSTLDYDGNENVSLMDMLEDTTEDTPDKISNDYSLEKFVENLLKNLCKKDEYVLKMYFGIGTDSTSTLDQIGERMHLTRERVRQIKEKCMRHLKQKVKNHGELQLYRS